MTYQVIDAEDVSLGDEVSVYFREPGFTGEFGQGGVVVVLDDDGIGVRNPLGDVFEWPWERVTRLMADKPLDPTECLEYGDDCAGPVELRWPGVGYRSWPRCEHHGELRVARVSELERYAESDVAPAWHDPSAIGESWDGE